MKKNNIEIMAPVGSYEALMAAIQAGAGSVYFGIGHLNMRSNSAGNFTEEDLQKITEICRKNNVKSYLTLNTVVYDHDLLAIYRHVDLAKTAGISAIIASDISVIQYAVSQNVEIHISTQQNITNIEAVKFFSQFADVVVTARELSLKQVKHIAQEIERQNICGPSGKLVEIEMFAHGALCMAVSGKCYLSLHEQNASANRGACMQTCRKGYIVTEKESGNELEIDNEYIMSPKDLCTIGFLNKVLDAGVKVLKIEGRARPAEYVKTTVECYREAIDAYYEGTYNPEKIEAWKKRLSKVFNRGFWDGYYLGKRLGEWNDQYGSRTTHHKIYVAKGMNYFSKIKVAELKVEAAPLSVGDEIIITGPTTGVIETTVKEIRKDDKNVQTAKQGDTISIPLDEKIRRADKIFKLEERTIDD